MDRRLLDVDRLRYALCKQLPTAHSLHSSYGELELDAEMRLAVERVISKIIEKRLKNSVCSTSG